MLYKRAAEEKDAINSVALRQCCFCCEDETATCSKSNTAATRMGSLFFFWESSHDFCCRDKSSMNKKKMGDIVSTAIDDRGRKGDGRNLMLRVHLAKCFRFKAAKKKFFLLSLNQCHSYSACSSLRSSKSKKLLMCLLLLLLRNTPTNNFPPFFSSSSLSEQVY